VNKNKTNHSRRCKLSVMSQRNPMQISVQCMGVDNLWSQMLVYNIIVPHKIVYFILLLSDNGENV
jgi:hypothetical protein